MSGFSVRQGIFHLDRSAATDLETIVHGRSRRERVGSEAGRWVIHLKFANGLPGLVLDAGIDPITLAATGCDRSREHDRGGNRDPYPVSIFFQLTVSFPLATE